MLQAAVTTLKTFHGTYPPRELGLWRYVVRGVRRLDKEKADGTL